MKRSLRHLITLTLLGSALTLVGCATPPKPLRGDFSPVVPAQAAGSEQVGDTVRWGGRIIAVAPTPEETCMEILGRELSASARPTRSLDQSQGRFLACRSGFYDPAIFTTERDVTITGRIVAFETHRIGEYEYRYPRVAADVIYLWPLPTQERAYYNDPFWPSRYGPGGWNYPYPPILIRTVPKTDAPPPPPSK